MKSQAAALFLVSITLSVAQTNAVPKVEARSLFVDNQLYRQGGIGQITSNVYVVANSANNEIILGVRSPRWIGKDKSTKEIVYIQNGKVCDPIKDKTAFSITNCILVAFEPERIYVFDFKTLKGGFYLRDK
jgi:hypothetical protein